MAQQDDQTPVTDMYLSEEKPVCPTTVEIPEGPPEWWSTGRKATLSPVMLSPGSTTQKLIASGKIKSCFILLEKTNYDPSSLGPTRFNYEDTGESVGGDGGEKACQRPTSFREFNRLDTKSLKERSDVNRNVFTSMLRDLNTVPMDDGKEHGVLTDRVSPEGNMVTTPILMSDSESDQMMRTYEYPSVDSDTIGDTFSVNFDAESISSTGSSETLEYSESIPEETDIERDFDEVEEPCDGPPRLEILDSWTVVSRPTFDDPPMLSPPLLTTENRDLRCSPFTFPKPHLTASSPNPKSRVSRKVEESKTFGCQDAECIPFLDSRESSNYERPPSDKIEKTKSIESLEVRTGLCVPNTSWNKEVFPRDSHQFSNNARGTTIETAGDQTIEGRFTSKLTPTIEHSGPHSNQHRQLNDSQNSLNISETQETNDTSKTMLSKPSRTVDGFLENLNPHDPLSSEERKSSKHRDKLSIATSQRVGILYQQSSLDENVRDVSSPTNKEHGPHQSHACQSSESLQSSKTNVTGTDPSSARNGKMSTLNMTSPLPDLDSPGHSPGHCPVHSPDHTRGHIHDSSRRSPTMSGRFADTEDVQTVHLPKLDVPQNKDVSVVLSSEETISTIPSLVISDVQSVQVQTVDLPGAIETIQPQQTEFPPGAEPSDNIVNDVFFASSAFSADTATDSVANSQESSRESSVTSLPVDDENFEDAEYQQIVQQMKEGSEHPIANGGDTGKDLYAGALPSNDHPETTQGSDPFVYPTLRQKKEKEDHRTDDVSKMPDNIDDVASSRCDKMTSPEYQPLFTHEVANCPEICGYANEVTVEVCDFESVDSSVSEVNSEIERAVASITDRCVSTEKQMAGVLHECLDELTPDEIRQRLEVTDSSSCASSTVEVTSSTGQVSVDIGKDQTNQDSREGKRSVNKEGGTNEIVDDAEGFVQVQASSTVTSVITHTPTTVPLTHQQKHDVTANELCKVADHRSVQETSFGVPVAGIKPRVISSLRREDDKTPNGGINQTVIVDVGSKTGQNQAQQQTGAVSPRSDPSQFDKDSRRREIDTAISLAIMSEITTLPSIVDPNYKVSQSIATSGATTQETNTQSSPNPTNIQLTSSVQYPRGPGEMRHFRPARPRFPGSKNQSRQMFTSQQLNSSSGVGIQGSLNPLADQWSQPRSRGRYKSNFTVVDYSAPDHEKPEQFIELRRCLTQERRMHPDFRPQLPSTQPPLIPPDQTVTVSQHNRPFYPNDQFVNIRNGVPIEFPGGKRFIAYNKEAYRYPPQNPVVMRSNEQLTAQNQHIEAVSVSRVPPQLPQIAPNNVQSQSNTAVSYSQQHQYPRPNPAHPNLSVVQYPMHPSLMPRQQLSHFVNATDRARQSPVVYPQQGQAVYPSQNATLAGSRHDQSHRTPQQRASTPRIASVSPDVMVGPSSSEQQSQARERFEQTRATSFPRAPQFHEVGPRGQSPGAVSRGLLMTTSATNQGAVDNLTHSYQAQQQLFRASRGDVEGKQTPNKVSTLTPTQVTPAQNPPHDHITSDFEHLKRMATAAATNKMIRSDVPFIHQNHPQKAAPRTNYGQPPGADQADRPAQADVTAQCDPTSLPASAFIGNLAETNRMRAMSYQEVYDARNSRVPVLTQNETAAKVTPESVANSLESKQIIPQVMPQSKDDQTIGQREGPSPRGSMTPTPTPPPSTRGRTTRTWTSTEEALLKSLPEELASYLVDQCRKGGAFRETLKSIIEDSLKEEEETQNEEALRVREHTVHHLPNQTHGDAGHTDGHHTPYADQLRAPTKSLQRQGPTPPAREQYDTQPQQQAVSLTTHASETAPASTVDTRQQHSKEDQDYGRKSTFFFNPAPSSSPLLEADNVLDAFSQGAAQQSQRNKATDLSIQQQAVDLSYKQLINYEQPVYEVRLPMPYLLSNSHLCHRAFTSGERGPIRASSVVDLTSIPTPPPIHSFLKNNLSPTQLTIRNKLLERRSRILSRSMSTPDILHGYTYPAKLVEPRNFEAETTSSGIQPTVQGARRDGRCENPVTVITSSHSVSVDQTIHQVKDAIGIAMNRKRASNQPFTLGPDTTAKYPKMKSKLQNAWIDASGQQPLLSGQQPLLSGQQPLSSGQQPLSSGQQPLSSGQQPLLSGQQPLLSGQQPLSAGQQPLSSGQQPLSSGQQPLLSGQQPLSAGQQPLSSSQQPLLSGQQPLSSVQQPHSSGQQPLLSGQQPLSSKDSQENLQPSLQASPSGKPTSIQPQPSTFLHNPNKSVTRSPEAPAITKPVSHVAEIPNPSSKMLTKKRKRGRPPKGPISKKPRSDASKLETDLECQFCSFKSYFRSEIRAHVKNDHFAKFCKETTTTPRKKKAKRDHKNKPVTNKVHSMKPMSPAKIAAIVPGPPHVSIRNTLIPTDKCNISNSPEIRHSSGSTVGAVTTTTVNVIPGNLITNAGHVTFQNEATTGSIVPMKQVNPQVAMSTPVQQNIQPAYAPYTKTQMGDTRAAEASSLIASPAATTSTVRPSLNERPIQTPYRCTHCNQYCNSSRELLIHNKFQHTNTKGLHMCFNCGYTTKAEYQLRKHILKWHQKQGVENHKCTRAACGQSFPTQDQLQTHIKQTHDAGDYVCTLCDAKYLNITGLRYHQQRHKLNYPHKCKECGLKFKSLGMLNRHEFQKNHISS
ncbi:uncharacterized protein [Asterias amurensis]|uniref:uncharacterized protein n=1 Tax=Asterias amurensis TaxID=7602 RepID=UPI003AB38997